MYGSPYGHGQPEPVDVWAELKKATTTLGDMRKELIKEGFTEDQAFEIVIAVLRNQ